MPSLRSTPCKSKLEDDRWQDFDAFRSQSQSASTTSKIVKGKAATGKTKGAKVVKNAKGADEKGVKALEGVEERVKGEVKEEAKEDVGNEVSDEDMSGMSEASEASEGRVVEEDEEMGEGSEELSEQEDEEEKEEEDAAEGAEDEGTDEEGSDANGANGKANDNSDGHDSARGPPSPRRLAASPSHDRKPSLSDTKPSLSDTKPSATKLQPPHVPGPFNKLADDLIMEIAHHLLAEEAYASAVALSGMSKRTKVVLRPLLRKTKKRVVLDLDDLRWVSRKTWKNIRIITCTNISALPFKAPALDISDDDLRQHNRTIRRDLLDLKPWAMVYQGEPTERILDVQSAFFPTVKVIRINVNQGVHEMDYLNPGGLDDKESWTAGQVVKMTAMLRKQALVRSTGLPELRVRYHHRYVWDMQEDRPGQMLVCWRVKAWGQSVVVAQQSYDVVDLDRMEDDFKDWLWKNKEHSLPFPESLDFETISLDLYYQPRPSATGLFYSVDDEFPAAYDILTEYADHAAKVWLEASTQKPMAEVKVRLFVQHGEFVEREKMKPVFKTYKAKKFDGLVKTRELFIDDDDFAQCVQNGGCSRCKGTAV